MGRDMDDDQREAAAMLDTLVLGLNSEPGGTLAVKTLKDRDGAADRAAYYDVEHSLVPDPKVLIIDVGLPDLSRAVAASMDCPMCEAGIPLNSAPGATIKLIRELPPIKDAGLDHMNRHARRKMARGKRRKW